MPVRISPMADSVQAAADEHRRLARELRVARLRQGLSQAIVARRLGVSASWVSRAERAVSWVSIGELVRHSAAVGLRLRLGLYPIGRVALDAPQLGLLAALRRRLGAIWAWELEVPMPLPNDLRAADAVLTSTAGTVLVEAVTRLVDVQATLRAVRLKRRDLGADRWVLLLAATDANRRLLREAGAGVGLVATTRRVMAMMAAGELPPDGSIVVLPIEQVDTNRRRRLVLR